MEETVIYKTKSQLVDKTNPAVKSGPKTEDYNHLLTSCGMAGKPAFPYLTIKDYSEEMGWRIHISLQRADIDQAFCLISAILCAQDIAFNLPLNGELHDRLLDGRAGLYHTAKVINVFPENNLVAALCATQLSEKLKDFEGPAVPSAYPLGACLYVSYGQLKSESLSAGLLMDRHFPGSHPDPRKTYQKLPKGVDWPFGKLRKFKPQRNHKRIGSRYLKITLIKDDPKGQVYKCIDLRRWRFCLIKMANAGHCHDNHGRDIRDRLQWQFKAMASLAGNVPIPRVFELTQDTGSLMMAMEYIEGASLSECISLLYSGTFWRQIPSQTQRIVFDYAFAVMDIVGSLHAKKYVHRDLNPENFIVDANNQLYLIDFELAYQTITPADPPFTLGTPGYTSPEQIAVAVPDFPEDIYGLSSLLIKLFTGLSPLKFDILNLEMLEEQLGYFIPYEQVIQTIRQGLNADPKTRPGLQHLQNILHDFRETLSGQPAKGANKHQSGLHLLPTIHKGIKGLDWRHVQSMFMSSEKDELSLAYGTTGILYVLSRFKSTSLGTSESNLMTEEWLEWWMNSNHNREDAGGGFLTGVSGKALVLIELYRAGLISRDHLTARDLHALIETIDSQRLGLADGLAGKGMLILHCLAYLQPRQACEGLTLIVNCILSSQNRDGSWSLRENIKTAEAICLPGLYQGIAGIAWFLMSYVQTFRNKEVTDCIKRSLDWLKSSRVSRNGVMIWTLNPHLEIIDPWLENGFTGIALTFIRAYEVFRSPEYKEIATSALLAHPEVISSNYLSLSNGLAGLGEVYLEAARIFEEDIWKSRADRIVELILHTGAYQRSGAVLWMTGDSPEYEASLLAGQAGILHFLLRYQKPDLIGPPLLSLNH